MNDEQTDFFDYCTDGKHVVFPPSRVCYCGAIFLIGPLPTRLADTSIVDLADLSGGFNLKFQPGKEG